MLLVVGRLGRPHGVRGEITVQVLTDEPDERLAVGSVLATEPASAGPLTVQTVRWHSGRLLLTVHGVADRSTAESLRGVLLHADVDPDQRPQDPEEFYDRQLVGLSVVTVDGLAVGEVAEVIHLPAQDVLAVRREGRSEALVPLVATIVPEVDLPGRRVVIDPPPGLLDLDLPETVNSEETESRASDVPEPSDLAMPEPSDGG
ncbi:MAG: ribosome maturation factor RimM [Candidatus Nanopelagicales bacterium]